MHHSWISCMGRAHWSLVDTARWSAQQRIVVEELFIETNWMTTMRIAFPQQFCWRIASARNALLLRVSEWNEEGAGRDSIPKILSKFYPHSWKCEEGKERHFLNSMSVCLFAVTSCLCHRREEFSRECWVVICIITPTEFQLCKKELKLQCMLLYSFVINSWTGCKKIQV
jgi:hypothetical protein